MTETKEEEPAAVSKRLKQAGEIRSRWEWVEPSIWTDRMLTALENGVKGGVWFSLIDKVHRLSTLEAAWKRVRANQGSAGVDGQSIERFEKDLKRNLEYIREGLRKDKYCPQPIKRVWIDKPGSREKRPLGIPTIRDRVVQTALRLVVEPIFEREFAEQSYGFRPGRGCRDALRRVDHLLKAGQVWVVDADLKGYFDSIPHDRLMEAVRKRIADGRVLRMIEGYLKQNVLEEMSRWTPERGSPQGAVISPLLSNLYLHPLDVRMAEAGYEMVRYADDFVILCQSRKEAESALDVVRVWVEEAGLQLHPEKTKVVDARRPGEGFDFLGYHLENGKRWPRKKSLQKFKDSIRAKTKRCNGHSLTQIIEDVNGTLRGWFGYFQYSHRTTFPYLDGWIRRRLRSILRKRTHLRGISRRGRDHQRWPNSYFREAGLFCLEDAWLAARQSRRG
jgi:RNA-directed DNA polymerase